MDIDLITRLKGDPAIAGPAGSISWVTRPTKAQMPGITLQRLAPGREYTFKGAVGLQDTLTRFDFWGLAVRDIKPLFLAVLARMEQPQTVGGTRFGRSTLESERDIPAELVPEIGTVFRISADFRIWWKPL
ncbi:hypothetical protein [Sphingobium sp. Cam5-1]|uniref:hypothetical protein n=1 Tax=Sphingobium sp. Cam5-1 TaxID=2789327 RepID=UPI0018AD293D|nr:hypothetical protein [Sphingobium sp. Cam5-1]QPI73931.1 hypothetical protein IZV00_05560 [Sphingobium sp. Cam5-1]